MKRVLFLTVMFYLSIFIHAQDLKIAVGLSIPPYIIKKDNSGFQLDLIQEVFKSKGYRIEKLVYASNKRITKLLENKEVDAAVNLQPNLNKIFYSDEIANFYNVAIALKKRDIQIDSIFDLHYKRVYAFQNAYKFLGPEFAEYAHNNRLYSETIHQTSQIKHLVEWRVDVAIADKHVFMYFLKNNFENLNEDMFNFFDIFPDSPRYIGFVNQKIQKEFNDGLQSFKLTTSYKELIKKYNLESMDR